MVGGLKSISSSPSVLTALHFFGQSSFFFKVLGFGDDYSVAGERGKYRCADQARRLGPKKTKNTPSWGRKTVQRLSKRPNASLEGKKLDSARSKVKT